MVPSVCGGHHPGSSCSRLCYAAGCFWRGFWRKGPPLSPQEGPTLPLATALGLVDGVFLFLCKKNLLELDLHVLDEGAPGFPQSPDLLGRLWASEEGLAIGLGLDPTWPHRAGSTMVTRGHCFRESDRCEPLPCLQMSQKVPGAVGGRGRHQGLLALRGAYVTSGKGASELSSGREQTENLCGEPVKHD